jgi:phage tail sheath protein FI
MVRGRLDVQGVRKVYNEGMRETLASIQINPMRVVPNSGVKIWGDSTAQTRASALSNVNVRRLMCYLEKSLSIALLYNVFDPNDNVLRAQIRSICDDFLRPLLYNRALKEYTVVCDDRNNTAENTDAGQLLVDVYLKPVLPSKVIVLSAVLTKTGADFNELIASNAARG